MEPLKRNIWNGTFKWNLNGVLIDRQKRYLSLPPAVHCSLERVHVYGVQDDLPAANQVDPPIW